MSIPVRKRLSIEQVLDRISAALILKGPRHRPEFFEGVKAELRAYAHPSATYRRSSRADAVLAGLAFAAGMAFASRILKESEGTADLEARE